MKNAAYNSVVLIVLGVGLGAGPGEWGGRQNHCCDSVGDCPPPAEANMQTECVDYDPETRDSIPCNESQAGWCAYFYSPAATYPGSAKGGAKGAKSSVKKPAKPILKKPKAGPKLQKKPAKGGA